MGYYCIIEYPSFISNSCLRILWAERPMGCILSFFLLKVSLPARSHHLFLLLSGCKQCKSHPQSSFTGIHGRPLSCFLLCLSHIFLVLLICLGIWESPFRPILLIPPQGAILLCISSYLSGGDHTPVLLEFTPIQRHFFHDFIFLKISQIYRCFFDLFCSF